MCLYLSCQDKKERGDKNSPCQFVIVFLDQISCQDLFVCCSVKMFDEHEINSSEAKLNLNASLSSDLVSFQVIISVVDN